MKKLTSISAYSFFIFLFFIIPFLIFIWYSWDYISNSRYTGLFLALICITILVIVYFLKFFLYPRFFVIVKKYIRWIKSYRAFLDYDKNIEIISYISHEIRSPILSSLLLTETLLDAPELTPNLHLHVATLYGQLQRMESIVSRVFSIQRYHMGISVLQCEPTYLKDFLSQEVSLSAQLHKNITFLLETTFDGILQLDKVQIRQVLTNLFENAIKHTVKKRKKIIAVKCFQEMDMCVLTIEDNGSGFQDIDMDKVFQKHSRWHDHSDWLGLGLYLCRQIVTSHHGTILAQSSESLGWAKFKISFPLKNFLKLRKI